MPFDFLFHHILVIANVEIQGAYSSSMVEPLVLIVLDVCSPLTFRKPQLMRDSITS